MDLADIETGSGLSKNSYTLAEYWGFVWLMFGLNTVGRCYILEFLERRSGEMGSMLFRKFLIAFQSEPFVGFMLEM